MTDVTAWADALIARHLASLTRPEFLRAARALSSRYVEERHALAGRSPLDSAGKRAAFAVLYGPIHFATTRAVADALALDRDAPAAIVDLGCGTGAASAGWAAALTTPPRITGVDRQGWGLAEARWTWRTLGITGRTLRGDLVAEAGRLARHPPRRLLRSGVLAAWSVNELATPARDTLLAHLVAIGRAGATVLVIEPVSTRTAPWWNAWADAFVEAGGRADAWRLPNTLPGALRELDRAAGFDRPTLTARSLALVRAAGA